MPPILRILRKDIRALWREILLVLAGTLVFVWFRRPEWLPADIYGMSTSSLPHLNYSVEELLQLIRCLLIVRVVHTERLVGDRQFWITRPYTWQSLLAEKSLFLFLFLAVPSIAADCALLKFAGFHPLSYVPQLLSHQAMILVLLTAPFFAIAAVARNLWQYAAPSIFLSVLWFLVIRPQPDAVVWFRFAVITGVTLTGSLAVLLLQYARRHTAVARILAAGTVGAVAVVSLLPVPDRIVSLRYSMDQTAPTIAFDRAPFRTYGGLRDLLEFPVKFAGIPQGGEIQLDGAKFQIEVPTGETRDSGWQFAHLIVDEKKTEGTVTVFIDRRTFEALKWTGLNLHVTVAFTLFQRRKAHTLTLQGVTFLVPEVGNCWWFPRGPMDLRCLAPFRSPLPVVSGATKFEPDCLQVLHPIPPDFLKIMQDTLLHSGEPRLCLSMIPGYLEYVSLSPVVVDFIRIGNDGATASTRETLCQGTEVVITTLQPTGRILRTFDVHDLRFIDH